jgi:cytochrome c2
MGTVKRNRSCTVLVGLLLAAGAILTVGCGIQPTSSATLQDSSGNPDHGKAAMERYGCGSCHNIPGVADAVGEVGPPLGGIAQRRIIGGYLANTPSNMAHWLQDPQGVAPGNAMPNMGVTDQDAQDMTAYLSTLK